MNPFERAREEASTLRKRLIGAGAPEMGATNLLANVEGCLNLAIELVDSSFSELGGGCAVLKREENYIYVREGLDSAEHNYLVAHELGHWILDVTKPQVTISDLKALTRSDGSPATLTVEAYGTRERQELLANVFARELLLPRALGKTLWLSGAGAREISQTMGVPLECVRLQLLDALLLPPPSTTYVPKATYIPSTDQTRAAQATERFVNVVAGPGTGKTGTLIQRVKYLIEVEKSNPRDILVLTFTNKAAHELIERLRDGGIGNAADIWAGTFHGFGLEFLRKYHHLFDLDANVSVADKLNVLSLLVKVLPQLSLKHYLRVEDPYDWLGPIIAAIKRLKEELVSPSQYKSQLAKLSVIDPELGLRRDDVATLYEAHERILQESKLVDFVDLVSKPTLALKHRRGQFPEIEKQFKHILVDEYQDVTFAMVELVRQLAINAQSIWVVGDVRQAIHHWRGASIKSLMRFEQTFKSSNDVSIQKYPLEVNRRSSQEIVNLVVQAGKIHSLEPNLALDAVVSAKGENNSMPNLVSCSRREIIPLAIQRGISKNLALGIKLHQQAVLCRYSADLETVADKLQENGIPVLYVGELAQRKEIKKILCVMQLLCERHPRALVGLSEDVAFALSKVDINTLILNTTAHPHLQRGRWLSQEIKGLTLSGAAIVKNLKTLLAGFSKSSNPWDFVCELILEHRYGLPPVQENSIECSVQRIALWQFAYSVRNGDGDAKEARLSRYLMRQRLRQRIGETYADRELPPEALNLDAVRLLTVHASKGLEYETIHLGYVNGSYSSTKPGWTSGESITELVPPEVLNSSQEEYDFETAVERNNLFYVALSRAKNHLYMYEDARFERERPPQLTHYPLRYGKFSFDLPLDAPMSASKSVHSSLRPQLKYDDFATYTKCPLQYHYRNELGLHAEVDAESSLRARWSIMETLKSYAEDSTIDLEKKFKDEWSRRNLADEVDDPGLFKDSNKVLDSGISLIKTLRGCYTPSQVSAVVGVDIHLPWMITTKSNYSETMHLIRFSASGLSNAITLLKPILSGLPGGASKTIHIHSLLSAKVGEVRPSGAVMQTKSAQSAIRLLYGDRNPTKGSHCKHCTYMTFCPAKPKS